jgi:hypothetical protein
MLLECCIFFREVCSHAQSHSEQPSGWKLKNIKPGIKLAQVQGLQKSTKRYERSFNDDEVFK